MIRDKLLMGVQKEDGFTYLYASGTAAFRVKKYYVDTLEQTDDVSAHLQFSNLTSMCHGNGALYVGRTTFKHVVKLDLHTLAGDDPLVVSPGYGGDVHAVCCFGDYVYAGGSSDSTSHSRVKRYNASDLTLEDPAVESANFGQPIRRLIPHGGYIYGGSGGLMPREFADIIQTLHWIHQAPRFQIIYQTSPYMGIMSMSSVEPGACLG